MLIPLVVGLWGLIAYRMISFGNEPDAIPVASFTPLPDDVGELTNDTVELLANYRDPFLGKVWSPRKSGAASNSAATGTIKPKSVKKPKTPPPVTVWPAIEYRGQISSSKGGRFAVLTIDEKELLLKENQEARDVTIHKIYKDSVILKYQKETKTYHK